MILLELWQIVVLMVCAAVGGMVILALAGAIYLFLAQRPRRRAGPRSNG